MFPGLWLRRRLGGPEALRCGLFASSGSEPHRLGQELGGEPYKALLEAKEAPETLGHHWPVLAGPVWAHAPPLEQVL